MVKIELLTSPTCPYCPMARKALEEFCKVRGLKLKEISTASGEGKRWMEKYGVTSVPSFLVRGSVRPVLKSGVPTQKELQDILDIAEGKKEIKRRSLFSRLLYFLGM